LRALAKGRGDIKGLQASLEGFNRLRIGGIRIIFRQISGMEILLEYANTHDVIYILFEQILSERGK
jgi:mRNA-degrading endonuclease RelE of RelBE toxin-antitoxin system